MNLRKLGILTKTRNPLILAVGGGNDSVSTLLLQKQLQHTLGYYPHKINIVAMLPDCLDYKNLTNTDHHLVSIISEHSQRSVQGKHIEGFPERILASNKNAIPSLPIENVYGISMQDGSVGVANALQHLISTNNFDFVFAIDVGGDFIAVPENHEVLSPMMDAYILYALKSLISNIPILYGVFGLGTDGETTPELLHKALDVVSPFEGSFNEINISDVIDFYRNVVEPNRYSRTADFTIKEIQGIDHANPAKFRGRFHVKSPWGDNEIIYGNFLHYQDPKYFGKYYLFDDISKVTNNFIFPCNNGLQWFINVQNQQTKINHELNGQCYRLNTLISDAPANALLFFGTPSRKFDQADQAIIANQILHCINHAIYDLAIVYSEQRNLFDEDTVFDINDDLLLIGHDEGLVEKVLMLIK